MLILKKKIFNELQLVFIKLFNSEQNSSAYLQD